MKVRKILAMTLAIAVSVCLIPFSNVQAGGGEWKVLGNNCYSLEGTDIEVKVDGETMNISGTGSLPSYDEWTLVQRPWRTRNVVSVNIASTIKSVGSNLFAGMDSIKYVTMGTSTFIEDSSAFSGIAYKPIFRIFNTGITTEMIGTISYTSLDSIIGFAQCNGKGAAFVLDSENFVKEFQNSTNPTILNVYYSGDKEAPWNDVDVHGNGNVVTKIASMSADTMDYSYGVSAQMRVPGKACYQAFAAFIGDYNYAYSIVLNVTKEQKKVDSTPTPHKYVIEVPKQYVGLGTTYKLLAIGRGIVDSYEDLDMNPNTITFETSTPSTTYAIVYK